MPTNSDIIRQSYLRTQAVWYLKQWLGTPYVIGWNDPLAGFDCNGLIHEVLQGVGIEKRGYDCTANDLYLTYKNNKVELPYAGCLVFFLREGKAKHVGMMIDDNFFIAAGGGDFETRTLDDAIRKNAYVKMDSLKNLGGNVKICDPFLDKETP